LKRRGRQAEFGEHEGNCHENPQPVRRGLLAQARISIVILSGRIVSTIADKLQAKSGGGLQLVR
jgi:hypothetical protein